MKDTMTEETLEAIILGHIAKELKDEIQIGRQVNLAKTIIQALRIHNVVGRSEQLVICKKCGSSEMYQYTKTKDKCEDCGNIQDY